MQAINLWEIIPYLFLGVFAQFQPLDAGEAGAAYELFVEGELVGQLEYVVEEAPGEADRLHLTLHAGYADEGLDDAWLRAGVALDDTTRVLQQITNADTTLELGALTLPPASQAALMELERVLPFHTERDGHVTLATLNGDSLQVSATVYIYTHEDLQSDRMEVAHASDHGLVQATAHLPFGGSIQLRLIAEDAAQP